VELLAPRARSKGLAFTCKIHPDVHTQLIGDPSRLRQILLNLLSNAVKFTEKGEVILEIARLNGDDDKTNVSFSVHDTGVGISPEAQRNLFQSFTQADSSTTRRFGGTGLGLAICHKLVGLMHGSINLTSVPGKGSTFCFVLPYGKQKAAKETTVLRNEPMAVPSPTQTITTPIPSSTSVLLAEDNKVNQFVAVKQLQKLGYQVDVVNNGMEALAAWRQKKYHVILMDCQMPEMDGYEATRKIRELETEQDLEPSRIVAMTASDGSAAPGWVSTCSVIRSFPSSWSTTSRARRMPGWRRTMSATWAGCTNRPLTLVAWSARPSHPLMRMLVRPQGDAPGSAADRSPVPKRISG